MSGGWDAEYDVVVVGSGAAGLTGAVTAAARGLRPLVIEKSKYWGGTSAVSGGALWIPANPLMRADGAADSVEAALTYLEDIVTEVGPASSRERKLAYLQSGPEMVRFLTEEGFGWVRAERYPDYYPDRPGARIGRSIEGKIFDGKRLGPWLPTLRRRGGPPLALHTGDFAPLLLGLRTPGGFARTVRVFARSVAWPALRRVPLSAGMSTVGQLMFIAQRRGVAVWLNSSLREVVMEGGRVAGLVVEREGSPVRVRAGTGVLLAAGGFGRAESFRRRYQPVGGEWSTAIGSDTGDAIQVGMDLGAATALMDEAWWGPAFVSPDGARAFSVWDRSMPGAIIVDTAGGRFANESASYLDVGRAILDHTQAGSAGAAWLILDARNRRRYPFLMLPPGITPKKLVESGFLVKAGSLKELAGKTGIDPAGLRSTIVRFNRFAATGVDEDFRRGDNRYDNYYGDPRVKPNPNLAPIEHPPFWAVRIYPGDLGTKGGLLTDEHARVLRPDGEPIPGLYGAGNTTASVMGRTYPGPGGTIGPATVFAYLAMQHLSA